MKDDLNLFLKTASTDRNQPIFVLNSTLFLDEVFGFLVKI